MNPCESVQAQLLDYVYDVLDEGDGNLVREHLTLCEVCRAAVGRAEDQKRLLARAAKFEFPEVRFGDMARPVLPIAGPAEPKGRRFSSRKWVPLGAAAAVLLAVGGFSIGAVAYWQEQDRLVLGQRHVALLQRHVSLIKSEFETKKHAIAEEVASAHQELAQLTPRVTEQVAKLDTELRSRSLHMTITGPPTVEAGAVNDFQVQVYNAARQPAAAEISAEVLDAKTRQVVSKLEAMPSSAPGFARVTLPRDLPLTAGCDFQLVVSAKGRNGARGELTEKLKLVAPVYLTHLATDKPMYQPGETVHFRSLTLERFSLKPAAEELRLKFTITTPLNETREILSGAARVADDITRLSLLGPNEEPIRGIGAGDYPIEGSAPGGEYVLTVSEQVDRFPPQQRKFIVNRYEKPRLNKELEFTKKSYGPGDEVVAACKVARAEGGAAVADQAAIATVKLDARVIYEQRLQTDSAGAVNVKFRLPTNIDRGDGSLSVQFTDAANVESIVRPIPVVLRKLRIDFFPEGGDLVAGVRNRVYFQAFTMLDKPAELKGHIVDENGTTVASAETLNEPTQPGANQGMGRFEFTPEPGKQYELKIAVPTGIEGRHMLPAAKPDGVVLEIPSGVDAGTQPIRVVLRGGKDSKRLLIGAYCRGRLMAHERVVTPPGQPSEVVLRLASGVGGVYRVTVFEEDGEVGNARLVPRAERLVYRTPSQVLRLNVRADKPAYAPGDQVTLSCTATDEAGKPASAVAMVAVVDKSVLKLADEKTFRNMPTHFLLTTEVRRPEDLEHADFLLGDHPKAPLALDLLLGTQGWRRFVEQHDPQEFHRKNLEEPTQLLVRCGRLTPNLSAKTMGPEELGTCGLLDDFRAKSIALENCLSQAENRQAEFTAQEPETRDRVAALQDEERLARRDAEERQGRFASIQTTVFKAVLPGIAVGLLAVCGLSVLLAMFGGRRIALAPCLAAAGASVVLLGGVVVYTWTSWPDFTLHDRITVAQSADHTRSTYAAPESVGAPIPRDDGRTASRPEPAKLDPLTDKTKTEAKEAPLKAGPAGLVTPAAPPPAGAKPMYAAPAPTKENAAQAVPKNIAGKPGTQVRAPRDGRNDPVAKGQEQAFRGGARNEEKVRAMPERNQHAGLDRNPARVAPPALERAKADAVERRNRDELNDRKMPFEREGGGKLRNDEANQFKKRAGGFGGRGEGRALLAMDFEALRPAQRLFVREYAHARTPGKHDVRDDWTETVYWHPVLFLSNGKAEAKLNLADSVTTFQVLAAAHTLDGRLGAVTADVAVRKPLTIEPKLPIEVTATDVIDVSVAVANGTDSTQQVTINIDAKNLTTSVGAASQLIELAANGRGRRVYRIQPTIVDGDAQVRFDGRAGSFTDSVRRTFKVVPNGFPIVGKQSDMLEKTARHELVLPETWIPGTLNYRVTVFPSTLADLQKGLEGLLREPNGCFEQTSTTNYPNLLILDYLKETDQAKPELARRAHELLGRGYQRLTSFECLNTSKNLREGYEWFGGTAPAHEALTAYGLMQFRDMARVHDVDKAMMERTRAYLMSRRDGKGGFLRNPKTIDSFGRAPEPVTNAYIVWALTESGPDDDLTVELNALNSQATESKDPYFLALVANSMLNRDRNEETLAILTKLVDAQKADGHLEAATTSITGSGGRDLQIETTALSVLAWVKAKRPDHFNVAIQKAVRWVGRQRGGYGGFGSTQSTILTMKALIAYAKANKKTAEAGAIVLYVGEREVARRAFAAGVEEAIDIELTECEKLLKPGKNDVRIEIVGKNVFPYTAAWSYRSIKPVASEQCAIGLTTSLDRPTANEGETVGLNVQVQNKSDKGQGMTVAVIGLPGGLTLPEDMMKLKELARLRNDGTERGVIDAWEIRGRELVLYWRDMAPGKKIDVNLELMCRVPGEYRGPASRAYLYYNADHKCWVEPLKMDILAKQQ